MTSVKCVAMFCDVALPGYLRYQFSFGFVRTITKLIMYILSTVAMEFLSNENSRRPEVHKWKKKQTTANNSPVQTSAFLKSIVVYTKCSSRTQDCLKIQLADNNI